MARSPRRSTRRRSQLRPREREDGAAAGIALGALLGIWDRQPRREILIAARTRTRRYRLAASWRASRLACPRSCSADLIFRRLPRLEIECDGDGGDHWSGPSRRTARSALGTAPTLVLMDERGHWADDRGDDLEHALLSGLGKRGGRALIISDLGGRRRAPVFAVDRRPARGRLRAGASAAAGAAGGRRESPAHRESGRPHGIGADLTWLEAQARRAKARGGSALTELPAVQPKRAGFTARAATSCCTVDEWMNCEVSELPARSGPVVVGIDLAAARRA